MWFYDEDARKLCRVNPQVGLMTIYTSNKDAVADAEFDGHPVIEYNGRKYTEMNLVRINGVSPSEVKEVLS